MRHSCGHKAPAVLPKAAVRNMPHCHDCATERNARNKKPLRYLEYGSSLRELSEMGPTEQAEYIHQE